MAFFNSKKKEQTSCGCGCAPAPVVKQEEACDCGGACAPAPVKEHPQDCDCGCTPSSAEAEAIRIANELAEQGHVSVKVLGPGCKKCMALEEITKQAVQNLGINTEVEHISDYAKIASYGVMSTPALVVDGKVVSMGKLLSLAEVEDFIKQAQG